MANEATLIYVWPAAILVMTFSSSPAYTTFYKESLPKFLPDLTALYVSSVTTTYLLIGLSFGVAAMVAGPVSIFSLVTLTALIEKSADELSRYYEFVKKNRSWFVVQICRSLYPGAIIVAHIIWPDWGYRTVFLFVSTFIAIMLIGFFYGVFRARPELAAGAREWKNNYVFNIAPATSQASSQSPRLLVSLVDENIGYLYQTCSQLSIALSIYLNAALQIPYRQIIARHTTLFVRALTHKMTQLGVAALTLSAVAALAKTSDAPTVFVVAIAVTSETLSLFLLNAHLGYLRWLKRASAVSTMIAGAGIYTVGLIIMLFSATFLAVSPTFIIFMNTILALILTTFIWMTHFARQF